MGHRLSKIVTRTGDGGTTGLADGSRVCKNDARIQAIGEIDELNSLLGVLAAESIAQDKLRVVTDIQHDLFDLGGELAIPGAALMQPTQVARLEEQVEQWNANLPALKEFILPGGTRVAALAFLARAVCRRAERAVVALATTSAVSDCARQYLNRLSDLLFVLGRELNRDSGNGDVMWQKGKTR